MGKIKLFLMCFLSVSFLFSCVDENETFTGFLVCKEYTPEHMSNESANTISYAAIFIAPRVPPPPPPPPPHKVEESFVWYIANKTEVLEKIVSKELFHSKNPGDRVTIKRY